jgi:hypothetical protein
MKLTSEQDKVPILMHFLFTQFRQWYPGQLNQWLWTPLFYCMWYRTSGLKKKNLINTWIFVLFPCVLYSWYLRQSKLYTIYCLCSFATYAFYELWWLLFVLYLVLKLHITFLIVMSTDAYYGFFPKVCLSSGFFTPIMLLNIIVLEQVSSCFPFGLCSIKECWHFLVAFAIMKVRCLLGNI